MAIYACGVLAGVSSAYLIFSASSLRTLFPYVGGTTLCESLLLKLEYVDRSDMHSALFDIVVAFGTPAFLTAVAVASRQRWACSIMAAVYTAYSLAFLSRTFIRPGPLRWRRWKSVSGR